MYLKKRNTFPSALAVHDSQGRCTFFAAGQNIVRRGIVIAVDVVLLQLLGGGSCGSGGLESGRRGLEALDTQGTAPGTLGRRLQCRRQAVHVVTTVAVVTEQHLFLQGQPETGTVRRGEEWNANRERKLTNNELKL